MKSLINNKFMQKVLKMEVSELYAYLYDVLSTVYGAEDIFSDWDNYMVFKGSDPIGLCAHLDTVLLKTPKEILYDPRLEVMMSTQGGLGADDRAGVVAILELVGKGYRPTLIFTNYEEIGGIGANTLIQHGVLMGINMKYIIEIDRRGKDDCVFYEDDNDNFKDYVESFGFHTSIGIFSDISIICPALGLSGVNLSAGYYNEHTSMELLRLNELRSTVAKVSNMLDDLDNVPRPFKYEYDTTGYAYAHHSSYGYDSNKDYSSLLKDDEFLKEVFGYADDEGFNLTPKNKRKR